MIIGCKAGLTSKVAGKVFKRYITAFSSIESSSAIKNVTENWTLPGYLVTSSSIVHPNLIFSGIDSLSINSTSVAHSLTPPFTSGAVHWT